MSLTQLLGLSEVPGARGKCTHLEAGLVNLAGVKKKEAFLACQHVPALLYTCMVLAKKPLMQITFIDTPGVLSGDKQRISRGYDFMKVCRWLAARSDLILLLFDAHKLDISDEFKEVIESIRSDGDKCRCVLNKADEIDGENLVKVYGALMWNLGKILQTPEVARMYVGSFWDEDYKCKDLERLLNQDSDKQAL